MGIGINSDKGIYICSSAGFSDINHSCKWYQINYNTDYGRCMEIKHKGGLRSIGPDSGIKATIFDDKDCKQKAKGAGDGAVLKYPGIGNADKWLGWGSFDWKKETRWFVFEVAEETAKGCSVSTGKGGEVVNFCSATKTR